MTKTEIKKWYKEADEYDKTVQLIFYKCIYQTTVYECWEHYEFPNGTVSFYIECDGRSRHITNMKKDF